jgi:hypothetical protein
MPGDPVALFAQAAVGDEAYTYEHPDPTAFVADDHTWVTDLEWFDDRDDAVTLVRKRWRLVEVETIVLPDPHDYGA